MNKLQQELRLIDVQAGMEKEASSAPTNVEILTAMLGGGVEKQASAPTNKEVLTAILTGQPLEKEAYIGEGLVNKGKAVAGRIGDLGKRSYDNLKQGRLLDRGMSDLKATGKGVLADIKGETNYMGDIGSALKHGAQDVSSYVQDTLMKPDQWGTGTKAAVYGGGGAMAAILATLAARKMMA